MSKSISTIVATIIYALFVIGIIGITATLFIALIYEFATHSTEISTAGYVLLAFVAYSIWLCYTILHRMNKKTKLEAEMDKERNTTKRKSISEKLSGFLSGFWICLFVIVPNAIVLSGICVSVNWITTLSTGDLYQAEIVDLKETKSNYRNQSRDRGVPGVSIHFSEKNVSTTATPIVQFQSKEGSFLERDLYFFSEETCEIGSRLPIYYSSLTDQAFHKSSFTYGFITVWILIFLFLLMLALALLSYALIGKIPDRFMDFWNRVKMNLFYAVMFIGLVGMTYFLGNVIIKWLYYDGYKQLPGIAIGFCFILFFGCLLGGMGMICAFCGTKPVSVRRDKKKRKKEIK